jgi:serine/threonine protein kinase
MRCERLADWQSAIQQTGSLRYESEITLTGQVLGSPNYISPEQAYGKEPVGVPTDLYSLGATLHFMISGVRPPTTPTHNEIIRKI